MAKALITMQNYYNGLDVQLSSGIANNAFYLLSEGGTHRLEQVQSQECREKAENIISSIENALTVLYDPMKNSPRRRAHTVQAAVDVGLKWFRNPIP